MITCVKSDAITPASTSTASVTHCQWASRMARSRIQSGNRSRIHVVGSRRSPEPRRASFEATFWYSSSTRRRVSAEKSQPPSFCLAAMTGPWSVW